MNQKNHWEGTVLSAVKIQRSSQDYLEAMLMMQEKHGYIRSIDVAGHLGVTKPSVSYAAKRLRENGYLEMAPDGRITLTETGLAIAQQMYTRHKLLTEFLVRLGVCEQTARADACRMEHDISDESFAAICRHVGAGTDLQKEGLHMRRSDREITDRAQILRVISSCDCCRVGFQTAGGPYLVPLNFAFADTGAQGALYFHGAYEGRKAALIAARPRVGFEMDCGHLLHTSDRACGYSFAYQSVIGTGVIAPVTDLEEKKRALTAIMAHYAPEGSFSFSDAQADAVAVFRLDIDTLSCKIHA